MKSATECSQWPHVSKTETLKAMWDVWHDMYVTNQQSINVHYHFEELYMWKHIKTTPMADHVATMLNLGQKITVAGEKLPDIYIAYAPILLLTHNQSWDVVKVQLLRLAPSKLTFATVSATLIAESNC